ncbi:MAG: ABC transporter ATP-binding protein [Promethearchaeota archaeon]
MKDSDSPPGWRGRARKYAPLLVLSMAGSLGYGLSKVVVPLVVGDIVDSVVDGGAGATLLPAVLLLLAVGGLGAACSSVQTYSAKRAAIKIVDDIRNDLFRHIIYQPVEFFDRTDTGDLVSRVTHDVSIVKRFLSRDLPEFAVSLFLVVAIISVVLYHNATAAAAFALLAAPLALLMRWYRVKGKPTLREKRAVFAEMNSISQDNLQRYLLVRAFSREEFETQQFERVAGKFQAASSKAGRLAAAYSSAVYFAVNASGVLVVLGAYYLSGPGEPTLGQVVTFFLYFGLLQDPLKKVTKFFSSRVKYQASAERIGAIFECPPEQAGERARGGAGTAIPSVDGGRPATRRVVTRGELEFRGVWFAYSSEPDKSILSGVSFRVAPGEFAAFTGPVGSGKSSLLKLVPRFYRPTRGTILLDGVDLNEYPLRELREKVGVVSQEPFVFRGSVASNIAFRERHRTPGTGGGVDLERVAWAAKTAKFHADIVEMPDEYDTVVGPGARGLSGGQKQRLSLARALYTRPRLLLVDDTTSAVDVLTAADVRSAIRELGDTTVLWIASRGEVPGLADRWFRVSGGRVVEVTASAYPSGVPVHQPGKTTGVDGDG